MGKQDEILKGKEFVFSLTHQSVTEICGLTGRSVTGLLIDSAVLSSEYESDWWSMLSSSECRVGLTPLVCESHTWRLAEVTTAIGCCVLFLLLLVVEVVVAAL